MKTKLSSILILFSLVTSAQYVKLRDFVGSPDGWAPTSSLIYDGTFLYGTTADGGTGGGGTVFRIMPNGSAYNRLLNFDGTNGSTPFGSLTTDGTYLYGMTNKGGTSSQGSIFKIYTDGTGFVNLFDFKGINGTGIWPRGALFIAGTSLYGMTNKGGAYGNGTIFKIETDGTGYTTLLDFNGTNGSYPTGALISDGTFLYGVTPNGGSSAGTVFKIKPDGTGYVKLYDFDCTNGGDCYPEGDLFYDGSFLYGMTDGGKYGNGSIFKIKTDGTGFTRLLDFDCLNGCGPGERSGLTFDGNFLYGMTQHGGSNGAYYGDYAGTIFKIKTDGTSYTRMYDLGGTSGRNPGGSLVTDGTYLYGTTWLGGSKDAGVIFKINNNTVSLTGVATNKSNQEIKIYPNPAKEILNIEFASLNENVRLKITNLLGEDVLDEPLLNQHSTFNTKHLETGVYFIRIENNGLSEVVKLVKED